MASRSGHKIDSGCSQTSVNRKLISEGSIKVYRKSTVGYVEKGIKQLSVEGKGIE